MAGQPPTVSESAASERRTAAGEILDSLERARTPRAFLEGLLHRQVERSGALHGVAWLPGDAAGNSVRVLAEEPARVGQQAAEMWRLPLARQASTVFLTRERHVERVTEPGDRLLEGRPYWGVSLPVATGPMVVAVITVVLTGGEQRVLDYAATAAEAVASLGLLFGTLQASRITQEKYDELCRAWDLVGSAGLGYPDPEHMALGLVNKAKEWLAVQRVSLGWVRRGEVKLAAVSEQDYVDRRTNLSRALAAAMQEAVDLERPVYFPPPRDGEAPAEPRRREGDAPAELTAGEEPDATYPSHEALADLTEGHAVATHPIRAGDDAVAVLLFEREREGTFTVSERRLQSIACTHLGTALGLAKQNARGPLARSRDTGVAVVEKLAGKDHVVLKLVTAAVVALVAIGVFGRWTLKLGGHCTLAPAERRIHAAPFDGILSQTMSLPGQIVKAGEPLCRFEDDDLKLSLREARSKLIATQKQKDVYFAEQKLAEFKMAEAQCEELAAQIALLDHRIEQAVVKAAVDGVVLSGDLRQSIGSPLKMGEALLEVAALDELLLLVEVDQGDVWHVAVGQKGTFVTKARPDVSLDFAVEKIRPMSETREGASVFVVEARVRNRDGWLRPGMEGSANIHADRHNLTWVFTRRLVAWVRMKLFM